MPVGKVRCETTVCAGRCGVTRTILPVPWCGLARGRARLQRVQLAVAEGRPELLGVLLAALHLHEGPGAAGPVGRPGAQQRRLPAAGRSGDDRHKDCVTGAKVSGVDIKAGL
jgi:hypothetical protein